MPPEPRADRRDALPGAAPGAEVAACVPHGTAQRIGRAATVALYEELALYPKPGLVSFVDCGSHADMDGGTFLRSLFALRRYFPQAAALGAAGAGFDVLERLGIDAERRMLLATGGINTHRGAVFTLGLLCASAGAVLARGAPCTPAALRAALRRGWGEALLVRCERTRSSAGQRATRQYGLRGAGEEAALGLPVLFDVAVPALDDALARGLDARAARLETLFHVIAVLDDTNLVHRGGLPGLRFAQRAAAAFLSTGGAARADAIAQAEAIHRAFVAQRLSPGGAADVLAAACWVQRVCGAA
ncbi:triphosphoribosyl-dephospho-CoA synthase MdcB [Methylibium sp. Root1272]|uniref:triphosphoribosyl-dephospho-CoA synthase MdcB n=1 Tax=Methylibium sp. Root1272 TaxID=1736441 RepID=UPI0009EC380A|nr:triphosphoribosyl-dephospho-CoA synthase MdcB [Methylibium sp. Root1272]